MRTACDSGIPAGPHVDPARLFELAPAPMSVVRGQDHCFTQANPAFLRLVGRVDVVGMTPQQALPEAMAHAFLQALDQVHASGQAVTVEEMVVEQAYASFVHQPLLDATGAVTGVLSHGVDVTAHVRTRQHLEEREAWYRTLIDRADDKVAIGAAGPEIVVNCRETSESTRAREELRERETRFRALVELIPQLVWSTPPDGLPDYYNQRWYEYTGMVPGAEQEWRWEDFLHPEDYPRTVAAWQNSLETGVPYEVEYRFRRNSDGEYRWFIGRALPLRDEAGRVVRWFGTCTDVHDERTALDKARNSEARFTAVAEATNDIVWDLDLATSDVWFNENVERVLRFQPGQTFSSLAAWEAALHPGDRARVVASLQSAIDEGSRRWSEEYRLIRGDGTTATVMDRGQLVLDASGKPVRMVGSIIDLTERARTEAELQQAHRLEALGRLAGGIAHDFNNLLTVITSYTEMLLDDLPADGSWRADVNEIRRAANRASALTRQMLAFSRRQVLQPRAVNLNEVVSDIERLLRRGIGERVRFDFRPDPGLAPVLADPGHVEQVIMNLALNARDAMPGGGVLTLATSTVHDGQGAYAVLTVADTGVGMDDDTLARAFEPFFTTKPVGQGTGLGLATVHGIITQSGGRIEVDTAPGAGTTFRILLPITTCQLPDLAADQPAMPPRLPGAATVLIVEDEAAVRAITSRSLTRKGYTVHQAENGTEALRLLDTELAVDLIISDLVMPGMGGRELARKLRKRGVSAPILFMSGYAGDDVPADQAIPMDAALLEKPFSILQLLSAVEASLGVAATCNAAAR